MKMKQPVVSRKFIQILTNTDQLTARSPPYWKYHYQNVMRSERAQGLATDGVPVLIHIFYPYKKCPSAH